MHVECRELRKSYGAVEVLRGVTATFRAGRVAALVGANGAGKTTLLRIVAGLQFADSGTISAGRVLFYGGFETIPLRGRVNGLRAALGLPPAANGGAGVLARLSRGQLHAVGLEIAVDLDPDVLLLDEPWTALDPDARDRLTARLRETAANGRVVVCSTHDLDEVSRAADDVIFLREGRAIAASREERPLDRDQLLAGFRGASE
ncbi:MAG: ATP-binding cassette domain-containing protein [Acidobacteriota bacterium]|nr:ATP-binding cassette domain-containing protein [Acidobacteriota bacterium]